MENEKELLENGWKKEMLNIHIEEYDENAPHKFRRLSYDIADDFTAEQIGVIKNFVNEVNNRLLNVKMSVSGTGYYKDKQDE